MVLHLNDVYEEDLFWEMVKICFQRRDVLVSLWRNISVGQL